MSATRVFLVEDEALISMEIAARLRSLGYEVCGTAARGEQAVSRILATRPDIAVVDVRLAGSVDGIEVARQVRRELDIPIVFTTAFSDDEVIARALQVAPFGYLTKPLQEQELHATLQAALRQGQRMDELRSSLETATAGERFVQSVLDALSKRVAVVNAAGAIVLANAAWTRYASAAHLPWHSASVGDNYLEACDRGGPDAVIIGRGIRTAMAGSVPEHSHQYTSTVGGNRSFLCRVTPLHFSGAAMVVVAHMDITAVEAATATAALNEQMFSSLALAAPVGIFRVDASGTWRFVNTRLCALAGVSKERILLEGWQAFVHPDDLAQAVSLPRDVAISTPAGGELRLRRPDGTTVWTLAQSATIRGPSGGVEGLIGTLTDISRRKRAESAMRFLIDRTGTLDGPEFLDAAVAALAEVTEADFAFATRWDADQPETVNVTTLYEQGQAHPVFQRPVAGTACADIARGSPITISAGVQAAYPTDQFLRDRGIESYVAVPLADRDGGVLGSIGIMSRRPQPEAGQITDIVRLFGVAASGAITRARRRQEYRDLWEFSPDGRAIVDPSGTISFANSRLGEILRCEPQELVGQNINVLTTGCGEDNELLLRVGLSHLPDASDPSQVRTVSLTCVRWDGSQFPAELLFAPMEVRGRPATAIAMTDISTRRTLEAQLARAGKMDAIGRLSGGMAHDFNNYLGVIIGNLELLKLRVGADTDARELLDATLAGATRASELVRSLLAFARRQPLQAKLIDVNAHVTAVVGLLRRIVGELVSLDVRTAPDIWPVKIDATLLETSLVNLATNARDAIRANGRITISTFNAARGDASAAAVGKDRLVVGDEDYVVIEVADDGVGMTPEQVEQAFEPFFSTKPAGMGTGLGLAMVYGFIRQSGGHVTISSELQSGSTIRIYLPRAHGTAIADAGIPEGREFAVEHRRTRRTILLVEDSAILRQAISGQLASLGHDVIQAADGDSAALILEDKATHLDLLFSDVVMPGTLDGIALARAAERIRPGIPILLMSGFPGQPGKRQAPPTLPWRLLHKPFRQAELAAAILDVLAEPARRA